jgi:hypothetical protein
MEAFCRQSRFIYQSFRGWISQRRSKVCNEIFNQKKLIIFSWVDQRERCLLNQEDAEDFVSDRKTLAYLDLHYKELDSMPCVVGRVVSKSQVVFFPHMTQSTAYPFPFHSYFVIDDGTEQIAVVLWLSACRDYFRTIHIGDIVGLRGFKVKPSTTYSREFSPYGRIELAINSKNPTGELFILPIESVPDFVDLPLCVEVPITTLQSLRGMDDGTICSVLGVVVCAGRVEIIKYKQSYHMYRWLRLRDDSTARVFHLKLFVCSQEEEFLKISAGNLFSCSDVKLHVIAVNSRVPTVHYLTTTKTSTFFSEAISPQALQHLPSSPRLTAARSWAVLTESSETFVENGLIPFPPVSHRLAPPPASPIPLAMVASTLAEMHHFERRQVVVQGFLAGVSLRSDENVVDWLAAESYQQGPPPNKRRRGRKGAKVPKFGDGKGATFKLPQHLKSAAPGAPSPADAPHPVTISSVLHVNFHASANEAQSADEPNEPVWCLRVTGLNGNESIDVVIPEAGLGTGIPTLLRQAVPGVASEANASAADDAFGVLDVCGTLASQRIVLVLDLFRHGAAVEVSLNRWCTASYLAAAEQ